MQKALTLLIAGLLSLSLGCSNHKQEKQWTEKLTKKVTGTVMPKLIKKLMTEIQDSGYESAVKMCSGFAPAAEKKFNDKFQKREYKDIPVANISFKRTALRVRNPKNKPDTAEKEQLEKWHAAEDKAQLAAFKKGDTWYGMQPIKIISDKCLACHGTEKTRYKDAYKKVKELYPVDKAVDYELGDLRGAVSVQVRYK